MLDNTHAKDRTSGTKPVGCSQKRIVQRPKTDPLLETCIFREPSCREELEEMLTAGKIIKRKQGFTR